MAKIQEYTRRDTFDAQGRTGMNINIPDAIANKKSKSGFGIDTLRPILEGTKEIANNMVVMKENYDKAKVNEFLNGYMKEANNLILNYRTNRLGRNARGATGDFEKWSTDTFNKAMQSTNDKEILLENKQQIELARDSVDRINASYINQVSNFEAQQYQEYENNSATGLINEMASQLSQAQNGFDFESQIANIYNQTNRMSQFKGQDKVYIDSKMKPIISQSLVVNSLNNALTNPLVSVSQMESDIFKKHMLPDDYKNTKAKVLEGFKNNYEEQISNEIVDTGSVQTAIRDILDEHEDFFGNQKEREKLTYDMLSISQEKAKGKTQQQKENLINIQNDILISKKAIDENGNISFDRFTQEDFMNLGSTTDGAKTINTLRKINEKFGVEKYDLSQGKKIELTNENTQNFVRIKNKIDDGQYKTIAEMADDIQDLTGYQQKELVGQFLNNLSFKKQADKLKKENGIDLNKEFANSFQANTGFLPKNSPLLYENYKREVSESLFKQSAIGGKIDYEAIKKESENYFNNINNNKTDDIFKVRRIISAFEKERYETKTKNGNKYTYKDRAWNLKKIKDASDDEDIEDIIPEDNIDDFYNYILYGDEQSAYALLSNSEKQKAYYMQKEIDEKYRKKMQKRMEKAKDYLLKKGFIKEKIYYLPETREVKQILTENK